MAASDQFYRNQIALDKAFAWSSILMLVSVVWMFAQDYFRPFKAEQRFFRDVESALAQRLALADLPSGDQFDDAKKAVDKAREQRKAKQSEIDAKRTAYRKLLPEKEKAEATFQGLQADLTSITSFYDIEVEHHKMSKLAIRYKEEIEGKYKEGKLVVPGLKQKLAAAQSVRDNYTEQLRGMQQEITNLEKPLTDAMSNWKKVNDQFESQVKLAVSKQWGYADFIRALPIIDGFASPIKIQQYTLETLPIDYNFKYVTRFDRCTTCHLGIDRPAYTRENIRALRGDVPRDQLDRLAMARALLQERKHEMKEIDPSSADYRLLPNPDQLKLTQLHGSHLTDARVNQFCAHPRQELFVGPNSKHPAEKFGCTSCHSGQGSGTEFSLSSHTPNSYSQRKQWEKEHAWEHIHFWDFPMNPMRFVESSCLKCHHQVTDLYSSDNKPEAPKLLRGYNLLRENGCFGCHEIHGRKNNRSIGPDLRLEPNPPLEHLTASERAKFQADPDNAPGNLRKVGPNLYRLSEKTSAGFTTKWLRAPREFRPDTRMPHFYGLSNNKEDVLPDDQKAFPNAEIHAITHYLFTESERFLDNAKKYRDDPSLAVKDAQQQAALEALGDQRSRAQTDELDELKYRAFLKLHQTDIPVAHNPILPGEKGDPGIGRRLFVEKGCMSCHRHDGTNKPEGKNPAIESEATFGPNLSQVAGKLSAAKDPQQWLRHWIKNPTQHSPRTTMPVTHLTDKEIADVSAWLLAQPPLDEGAKWKDLSVPTPQDKDLYDLALVYLKRQISEDNLDKLNKTKSLPAAVVSDLPLDERKVTASYTAENVRYYVGKKAIFRLGCFGCHDIPRFETAKPIGTGLNDWGKKDPERLAFEDVVNYVDKTYKVIEKMTDEDVKKAVEVGKKPYEKFFYHSLSHKQRDGYLHQKIMDPRSFDYLRLRPWDDLSRMPEFRFTRLVKKKGETAEAFKARVSREEAREEADAREAVMTFILGLTAEQVPMQHVNQPRGDRLAEVKGRQVLDKYNCAGCHVVRPGIYEFKASPQQRIALTERFHKLEETAWKGDYPQFAPDYHWQGDPASVNKDSITMYGIPSVEETENDADPYRLRIRLTQALRFNALKKGEAGNGVAKPVQHDLRAGDIVFPSPQDMLYPMTMQSSKQLKDFTTIHGQYGGAFSDLLVRQLTKYDPTIYALADGDSTNARAAGPPPLIGQGRRTQPEWLYQFLLNPHPVRKMSVLRMPKFNMSEEEARTLVDYFAAVERKTNSRVELEYPYSTIPQQVALDDSYWTKKNQDYVKRLVAEKIKTPDGKETTAYLKRLAELEPVWKQIAQDYGKLAEDAEAKAKATSAKMKEAEAEKGKADKALADNKDEGKKAALQAAATTAKVAADEAKRLADTWTDEAAKTKVKREAGTLDKLKDQWEKKEAYIVDGYRLVVNRNLCLTCHQVGQFSMSSGDSGQGPPLEMTQKRLRPDWTLMWVAHPERFLTYKSPMPTNFPSNEKQYQEFFVGSSLEQVTAIRDVLMIHERAANLPLNRYWALPLTGDRK